MSTADHTTCTSPAGPTTGLDPCTRPSSRVLETLSGAVQEALSSVERWKSIQSVRSVRVRTNIV